MRYINFERLYFLDPLQMSYQLQALSLINSIVYFTTFVLSSLYI